MEGSRFTSGIMMIWLLWNCWWFDQGRTASRESRAQSMFCNWDRQCRDAGKKQMCGDNVFDGLGNLAGARGAQEFLPDCQSTRLAQLSTC